MKTSLQNYIARSIKLTPILCFIFLLIACRVDKKEDNPQANSVLEISVSGINPLIESNPTKLGSINAADSKTKTTKSTYSAELTQNENFDVLTTFTSNTDVTPSDNSLIASKSIGKPVLQAAAPIEKLPSGRRYRVILYRVQGNTQTHWRTLDLTSGTQVNQVDTVGVVRGQTYRYIAYSYNDAAALPAFNVNNPVVPMGINKDFIYASNTITIGQYGNTKIDLTFQRKTSRLSFEVDVRGLFGVAINSMTVKFPNILKTGNLNLTTGQIVAGSIADLGELTYTAAQMTNVDGANTYSKRAYLYSVSPIAAGPINVNMSALSINMSDNTPRVFTFPAGGNNYPIRNFGLTIGHSSRAKLDLIESAITYRGVQWARSNLYLHTPTGQHRYRFYQTNIQRNAPQGYFSFKSHIPGRWGSTVLADQIDPCNLVYPVNRWKTPSYTDLNAIADEEGLLGSLVGIVAGLLFPSPTHNEATFGTNYIQYPVTAANGGNNALFGASSSAMNQLRFYYNGIDVRSNLLGDGWININLGNTYGQNAGLQSDTQGINLLGLVGAGAWGYMGGTRTTTLTRIDYAKGSKSAELLNVNLLGLNLLSSARKNIRCVRNPDWVTQSQSPTYNPEPNYRDDKFNYVVIWQ